MKYAAWKWVGSREPIDLVLKEVALRRLQEDEVLIKNTYIGLNPVDWKLIHHLYPTGKTGITPGVDGAGIVMDTGSGMKRIPAGARVCYHTDLNQDGSFAHYTIVKGKCLIHIPDKVSDVTAAAFPCPGLTAWQAFSKVPAIKGTDVFINGAGGMVGSLITQLAMKGGARVYVTASRPHHNDLYHKGVIAAIDYHLPDWKAAIMEEMHGRKFHAAFDTVSGKSAESLTGMLGYYGHIVSIQDRITTNPLLAFTTSISLHEIALASFHQYASNQHISELMRDGEMILNEIGNGTLDVKAASVQDFSRLNEALQQLKEDSSAGKIVIKV